VFLGLALPLAYLLMSVPIMAQHGFLPGEDLPGKVGLNMEEAASLLLVVALFAAASVATGLEGGKPAVRLLFRRLFWWRVAPVLWWLAAAMLPLATVAFAVILGDSAELPDPATVAGEMVAIGVALLVINIWEEGAWAGFLQTHLEVRHGLLTASALTAIPFAAVHMPLRVINGDTMLSGLVSSFVVLTLVCILIRSMLAMMLKGAGNSVLLVAVMHTSFNRSNNTDGLAADILEGANRQNAALLATVAVLVLLVALTRRKSARDYPATRSSAASIAEALPSRQRHNRGTC
jgi:membrane protease YdiL (CAAX protease family)